MSEAVKVKNTVTLNIPSWMLAATRVVDYAKQAVEKSEEATNGIKRKEFSNPFNKLPTDKIKEKFSSLSAKAKKNPKISIIVATILLIVFVGVALGRGDGTNPIVSGVNSTDYSADVSVNVNKIIEIPIRQQDGEDTGDTLKIKFTNIEKAKRILIKGQGATARDGKAFVILNIEVENNTTNQLTVRPVDFIRLVESEERSFAPDVHNDDVEVEAISIKKTRVGYVVNEEQSVLRFSIGEISGEKDLIEVEI